MNQGDEKLWINGKLQDAALPVFTATDRGSALGDGLFETIKIVGGKPCYFADHYARLCSSADVLALPIPYDRQTLDHALGQLARKNNITSGAARLSVSRGTGPRGLALPQRQEPQVTITITSGLPSFAQPPVLGLSSVRRNASSISASHKTLSYIDNIAARLHQQSQTPKDEVVILDSHGHIACASVANIFWWDGQHLHTPALACAILPGIMRARILNRAYRSGICVHEGMYQPDAILNAKAAFITNALLGTQWLGGLDFGPEKQVTFSQNTSQIVTLIDAIMAP